jgi:hypothetical protein
VVVFAADAILAEGRKTIGHRLRGNSVIRNKPLC